MIYKILGQLVNTLTTDGKYYILNSDNLTQPIQMQLSRKPKPFRNCLRSRSKFEHFEKKDDPQILCISEITDCERRA